MKTVVKPGVLLLIGVPAALRISLAFMAQTQLWAAPRVEPAQTAEGDLYHVLFLVLALFGAVGATLAVRRAQRREDELRKSTSALEESRRKYQVVADNTYDWEYWLDPAGRFQYTSPSCQRITGYAPAEFEADPDLLGRILHPEDQPRVASHWSSIEAGPRECELEFRIVRRDGEVRWISHRCRPVRDERGNWLGQRASNSDITSLRSAESQAGQRSNVLLSALLENLRTAVVAVDDRCRIVLVNRAFREMFGSASSDLLMGTGCLLADGYCRLHPGAAVGAEELQLADGRILQRDYVPLSAEGSYAGHLCMFLDVTSQKRAMQAIEERQSVLQAVLDNAPIGIWMLNGAGRMVFVNRAFCRSVGIPEERFVSVQHYSEVLDPASAAICMASDHAAMAQDTPHVSHENVLFVDGQYHDLEVVKVRLSSPDGEPAGLVGLSADVTARMRTEEQLKESEARYRGLIENLSAAVLVYNRDRTVELCNPAAATLLRMAREQLAGKAAMDPEWRFLRENGTALPEDEYPVNRVFATGTAIRNQVYSMVRGEGRDPVWTLCNAHPVFDKAGALSQVVVSFTDITEHKLAEQRLLQAQKMESVGRLAGGVAHDFSNILTVINGYSQLLLHKLDAADPLRPGLEEIALSGERAASLTQQLLAFSRRQDMQPRVFSLNDLLGGMRPMLVRLVGEDVDVRIRPGEGECAIRRSAPDRTGGHEPGGERQRRDARRRRTHH
ncbi:MAG: PAS domain-containing protein [Acidobacteria bacterium]|nr:PAS domain-containing protein [Acidobacteriota bacterium]